MFDKQSNFLNKILYGQIFLAQQLVKLFLKTNITPNQITLTRIIISLPLTFYLFSSGVYFFNLIGLVVVFISLTFDFVDGELARQTNNTSKLGKFLDEILDLLNVYVILVAVTIGSSKKNGVDIDLLWTSFSIFLTVNLYQVHLLRQLDEEIKYEISGNNEYSNILNDYTKDGNLHNFKDRFLINFIDVHHTSLSKLLFTISYILLFCIFLDLIYLCFWTLSFTFLIRNLFLLYIIYYLKVKEDSSIGILKFLSSRKNKF